MNEKLALTRMKKFLENKPLNNQLGGYSEKQHWHKKCIVADCNELICKQSVTLKCITHRIEDNK